jgi:hypothetical protein
VELPEPLADGVKPPQQRDIGTGEDQTAVLDARDSEDTTKSQHPPDLTQPVERALERLQHRMAETGVEMV